MLSTGLQIPNSKKLLIKNIIKNKPMKKLKSIILSMLLFTFPFVIMATSEPPNPGGNPQGSDPPLGGGAPIGEGLYILLGLGAAYSGRKLYQIQKEKLEE